MALGVLDLYALERRVSNSAAVIVDFSTALSSSLAFASCIFKLYN